MPGISNEVLADRIENLKEMFKENIPEMKEDIKITKEQAFKTNGRVNKHDDEIAELKKKSKTLWDIIFKIAVGIITLAAAGNQIPKFIISILHDIWITK